MIPMKCFAFSTFKKKILPIVSNHYESIAHFYQTLANFESTLQTLQHKNYQRKLDSFDKKFRRLFRLTDNKFPKIPLQLNKTHQFFMKNTNNMIFGDEMNVKQPTIEDIAGLTSAMVRDDLEKYLSQLIYNAKKHSTLMAQFLDRFEKLQEHISRHIFKGYYLFSVKTKNIMFKQETEYKGDFKFELVDDLVIIESLIPCLYHLALFNQCRPKLSLAAQFIVIKKWDVISAESLKNLLFCLVSNGKQLKFVGDQIMNLAMKLQSFQYHLILYMLMANIENSIIIDKITHYKLDFQNCGEKRYLKILKVILKIKYNIDLPNQSITTSLPLNEGEIFFRQFLTRFNYQFTESLNHDLGINFYTISNKKFMLLDLGMVNPNFELNGVGKLIKQCLIGKNQTIKYINWPRMLQMETRGQKQEYILSKFKGIDRPIRIRKRLFD